MADPVSFVAAGIGIADVALRVIKYLKDVKKAVETIEEEIEGLIKEVEGLMALHQQLEQEYNFHTNVNNRVFGSIEKILWVNIDQTLKQGKKLTQKLEVSVKRIYGHNPSVTGKRDGLIKQHRRKDSNPVICAMRNEMGTYHGMLQILLTCVSMHSAREHHENQNSQLEQLLRSVKDIERRLKPIQDTTLQLYDTFSSSAVYKEFTAISLSTLNQITASIHSIRDSFTGSRDFKNEYFDTPKPVDQFYTGRTEQAKKLKEWLLSTMNHEENKSKGNIQPKQRRFVIYGVGGSGKTQFCCKFAEDCQKYFWGVFWVDGSSRQRLKQTFAQNVSTIGKVEANEHAAINWLSTLVDPWLLIIDNADDPDLALDGYFPRGENRGHILITTRSPFNKTYGTVGERFFEFQGLKVDEASDLLLRAAEQVQPWDIIVSDIAKKIAHTLGYLALAITHAGRTIRNKYCTLEGYLGYHDRQWKRTRQQRQAVKTEDATDDMSVFATFEINRQAIEDRDDEVSRDALQLLNTFAFLHNQNIRFDILEKAVTNTEIERVYQEENDRNEAQLRANNPRTWSMWWKSTAIAFLTFLHKNRSPPVLPNVIRAGREMEDFDIDRSRAALRKLEQFSLIMHSQRTDSYSLHPLVHKWARERPDMSIAEQSVWCEAAAGLISHCILIPPLGNSIEDEDFRSYLLHHVDHVRECQASIEQRMRDKRIGRVKPFPIFEPTFNKEKAIMYVKCSLVYAQNGRWEEAKRLQMAVRDFTMKVLGMENTKTRRITLVLADTMTQLGQSDDAIALREKVLDACTTYVGIESLETLTTKCKIGLSRHQQGRFSDAKQILQEAVACLEKHHGPDHEDTLDAKDILGQTTIMFYTEDSIKQARELHLEAFEGMKRVHGAYHTRTLKACENLCMTAVESGDPLQLVNARKMMTEVLRLLKEKLGREHGFTLVAMANLSRLKNALGDMEGAEALLQEALPIGERNYGRDHMGCLWGRFLISKIWVQQEKWVDAEKQLLDVTERQGKLLQGRGKYHPDRLAGLVELATIYHAQGRLDECMEVADEALEVFNRISASEHPVARKLRDNKEQWMSQGIKSRNKEFVLSPSLRSNTF